jgi:hypothetical protein
VATSGSVRRLRGWSADAAEESGRRRKIVCRGVNDAFLGQLKSSRNPSFGRVVKITMSTL